MDMDQAYNGAKDRRESPAIVLFIFMFCRLVRLRIACHRLAVSGGSRHTTGTTEISWTPGTRSTSSRSSSWSR